MESADAAGEVCVRGGTEQYATFVPVRNSCTVDYYACTDINQCFCVSQNGVYIVSLQQ